MRWQHPLSLQLQQLMTGDFKCSQQVCARTAQQQPSPPAGNEDSNAGSRPAAPEQLKHPLSLRRRLRRPVGRPPAGPPRLHPHVRRVSHMQRRLPRRRGQALLQPNHRQPAPRAAGEHPHEPRRPLAAALRRHRRADGHVCDAGQEAFVSSARAASAAAAEKGNREAGGVPAVEHASARTAAVHQAWHVCKVKGAGVTQSGCPPGCA